MVRKKATSPIVFHGIDIRKPNSIFDANFEAFRKLAEQFCDFFWVASLDHDIAYSPSDVGVGTVSVSPIQLARNPEQQANAATRTGDLAKGLLNEIL